MDKQTIITKINNAITLAELDGEPWADAIDGRTIAGYTVTRDQSHDQYESGYYICSLEVSGVIVADVMVDGDTLSVDERELTAAQIGRIGGSRTSRAKRKSSAANGKLGGAPARYVIAPRKIRDGYALVGQDGKLVQEGYLYPTREAAMQAALQLWPASTWGTRTIRNGQAISIIPDRA